VAFGAPVSPFGQLGF
jgi:transposase